MLAAAALGALGAQLAEIRAAKEDWFVGAGRVDKQDVSLEADGAVTVRRQPPFDKALRNFPKMESPPKGKQGRAAATGSDRLRDRDVMRAFPSSRAERWASLPSP